MKNEKIKFNLVENAKDSLAHAVEHLTGFEKPTPGDLKRAILDVAHVVELILKERVRRIHRAFIWENIDKYPSLKAQTIGTDKAVSRLLNLEGIALTKDSKKTLLTCRRIRNRIEHFEFEIELKEARVIVGRMLSFIFTFVKSYLEIDLETDFKQDDRWSELMKIHEFWEAHSTALEKQLSKEGTPVCECPSCYAATFDLFGMECAFCGHRQEQIECDICHETVWETDTETFDTVDADGDPESVTVCQTCIERSQAEEDAL